MVPRARSPSVRAALALHRAPRLVTFRAHRSRPYSVHSRRTNSWHEPAAFLPCLGIDQASRRPRWIAIQLCYHLWLLLLARLCYIYRRWLASPLALTILSEHTTSGYFLSPWSTWALGARDKQRPSRLVSYMGYPDPRHSPSVTAWNGVAGPNQN